MQFGSYAINTFWAADTYIHDVVLCQGTQGTLKEVLVLPKSL